MRKNMKHNLEDVDLSYPPWKYSHLKHWIWKMSFLFGALPGAMLTIGNVILPFRVPGPKLDLRHREIFECFGGQWSSWPRGNLRFVHWVHKQNWSQPLLFIFNTAWFTTGFPTWITISTIWNWVGFHQLTFPHLFQSFCKSMCFGKRS